MISTVSLVALGGAIGAACRYLAGVGMMRMTGPMDFPLAIMTVNIAGSFLMGVFVVAAANKGLTHLSPFVMTGLLGGFTTFSAFSLDTMRLLQDGRIVSASFYVLASVVLSLMACFMGLWLFGGGAA